MIGNDIFFFNSLLSTNDYVKKHLDELEDGAIVVAKQQIAGRGRRGNQWISNEGNLFFTLRLKKDKEAFPYIMQISNILVQIFEVCNIEAMIKYPNDILVNGRKIAGVLIEMIEDDVVLGIGLNINEDQFEALTNKATSIKIESGKEIDPLDVLNLFIHLFNQTEKLTEEEQYYIYKEKSFVIGKKINFNGHIATITDITPKGLLKVDYDNTFSVLSMNEISLKELYYD